MYKHQILARSRLFLKSLMVLFPTLITAQTEKSAAFQTPLLEKQNLNTDYVATYADYRLRALEFGSITLRDAYVSPLRLQGIGFGFSTDHLRYTPQALKQYSSRIFSGFAIDQAQDFSLSVLNFAGQYSWQFPFLEKPSGWKAYLGPWVQGYGNLRIALQNVNNVLGYDAGLELGTTGRVEYKFKPGRREFILTQQLSVPLLGAFVRPLYTFTGPILGETDSEVGILQIGTLNRRFGWIYKASLDLYRKRRHKRETVELIPYRISYTFQYDQYSQPNRFQSVVQSIGIARILKF